MKIKEGKSALEQNLYRSFLLLSATLVLISLCFTLFFDISRQRKDMDKLISGTASYYCCNSGCRRHAGKRLS